MLKIIAKEVSSFIERLRRNDRLSEVEYQQHHRIFTDMSPLGPVLFLLFILAGVVMWDYVPRLWLSLFIFGFISDVAVKIAIVEYYKRRTHEQQHTGTWRRVLFFGVMYTSMLWGASTLFLLYPMPVQNLVVGIGVFSIALFIAITLARSYLPVQTVGACLSFLPMCIALLFTGVWQYQLLSLMLVFALGMMLMMFRNSAEVAASQLKEQARRDERDRIVRELHDGMGGHLLSAISLADKEADTPAVQIALRAALSEMRLLVNSADGEPRELLQVLGEVRSRIEPQIENAGLELIWDTATSQPTPNLPVESQLHLTRILQECVANVIKHASASTITVQARAGDSGVQVRVVDDGQGINTTEGGKGLDNMRYRAEQLGGRFTIKRTPEGTVATLHLPHQHEPVITPSQSIKLSLF
jgi:signal transduction histidine kinase